MTVVDFRFMRWNHACFGSPGTSSRHHRNRPGTMMIMVAVVTVMIVLMMMVLLMMRMLMMTAIVTTTVRKLLRGMAHRFRGHSATATGHHAAAIVLR